MFLKELKRGNSYKQQKTGLFLDDFQKMTVVMQETDSNLIIFHKEFSFDIGFKLDYFKTITNYYDFLKYVFYESIVQINKYNLRNLSIGIFKEY